MTSEELNAYLKKTVTPQNFYLFSALSNLKNIDNYRLVLENLYNNIFNLTDIARLPLIDDTGIAEMLSARKRLLNPNNIITSNVSKPTYSYLMGTDATPTKLSILMKEYNAYLTLKASSPEKTFNILPILYTDFNQPDSKYSSKYEIQTALVPKIANLNAKHPLPVFTPNVNLTVEQKAFLNKLSKIIFDTSAYTSEYKLAEMFVWTNDNPSLISAKAQEFTLLLNLEKYNENLELHLKNDVFSINPNVSYNTTSIKTLWTNFFNTSFSSVSTEDVMVYCLYTINKIMTIEQNNNLSVSTELYNDFLRLYTHISNVSTFLQETTLDFANVLSLNIL